MEDSTSGIAPAFEVRSFNIRPPFKFHQIGDGVDRQYINSAGSYRIQIADYEYVKLDVSVNILAGATIWSVQFGS